MKYYIMAIMAVQLALLSPHLYAQANQSDSVIIKVMYFHGPVRCPTCLAIEKFTESAVNSNFEKELANGKITFSSIDFQTDSTEHFAEDYKFDTQTLIIAKFLNGRQIQYKNLDKIWDLSGNYTKFEKYIKKEITSLIASKK